VIVNDPVPHPKDPIHDCEVSSKARATSAMMQPVTLAVKLRGMRTLPQHGVETSHPHGGLLNTGTGVVVVVGGGVVVVGA